MQRRDFMWSSLVLAGILGLPGSAGRAGAGEPQPFSRADVIERARKLAEAPFAWPGPPLPDEVADLSYSDYQSIRFKEERRIWAGDPAGISVDLFHSGFIFNVPVEIFLVEDDTARKVEYDPALFSFGPDVVLPEPGTPMEFAGFRARTGINDPAVMDEFLVFLGASYFRAIGKGQNYGLSARGLAINTASADGEEFPFFRSFWLERPDSDFLVVHALLDSPSASGAYRFTVRPGESTVMDVEATLFTRAEISHVGLAPLTSMYLYSVKDKQKTNDGVPDFRPAIHDSDGLLILNGHDEWLWRPLSNPSELQVSAFLDTGVRGFGLMQRERRFVEYEDLEALYHIRPSLWVEPIGDWQKGAVTLIEIPTREEIHDNIVAFWRPRAPLPANSQYTFTYRLHWGWEPPMRTPGPRVARTLSGRGTNAGWVRFIVDFNVPEGSPVTAADLKPLINASRGSIHNPVTRPNPEVGGVRVAFELDPEGEKLSEMRIDFDHEGRHLGESWVYRWTA